MYQKNQLIQTEDVLLIKLFFNDGAVLLVHSNGWYWLTGPWYKNGQNIVLFCVLYYPNHTLP